MQEQKKNTRLKSILRFRKLFKNHKTYLNPLLYNLNKKISFNIHFKIHSNNVFCSLVNPINKKMLLVTSSGKEKISTSKKSLIFSSKLLLILFIKKIKNLIKKKNILVNIIAPLRVKILVLKLLNKIIKKNQCFINLEPTKCFNGCKPPKKRRKKQRGLRIFK